MKSNGWFQIIDVSLSHPWKFSTIITFVSFPFYAVDFLDTFHLFSKVLFRFVLRIVEILSEKSRIICKFTGAIVVEVCLRWHPKCLCRMNYTRQTDDVTFHNESEQAVRNRFIWNREECGNTLKHRHGLCANWKCVCVLESRVNTVHWDVIFFSNFGINWPVFIWMNNCYRY